MSKYGYVRVSTRDQNPERQLDALDKQGVKREYIFIDQMSGKDFKRPNYRKMIRKLKNGDIVVIKSIDRLGRNYNEILEQWRLLTKDKCVDIEVIDMPLLSTNFVKEGLTGKFIADLVLQILAYVAETERIFIKQRQAEGIAAAKLRGVHFGADKKSVPKEFIKYCLLYKEGKISIRNAAKRMKISPSTFYRRYKEWEGEQ